MSEQVKHPARLRGGRVACLSMIAVLAAGLPALAAPDKGSQWAPADAVFYIGCENVNDLFEAYKKTNDYKKLKDPKLEEVQGQVLEMVKPVLGEALEEMGFGTLDEMKEMGLGDMMSEKVHPRGPLCVFASAGPDQGGDKGPRPDLALIADMGDDFGKFKEMFDKFIKTRLDKGGKKETTEFNEVSIVTISNEAAAKPAKDEKPADDESEGDDEGDDSAAASSGDAPPPVTYAYKDKMVLICSNADVAKETLRRMKEKQSDSLSGSDDYANLERACSPVGQVRVFVNLPRIFALVEKYDKNGEDFKNMQKMGMTDWKSIVGTVRVGSPKGAEMSMQMNLPLGSAGKGLAKLLAMKNGPIAPPAHVDADTAMVMNMHVSPPQFYDDLLALMEKTDPDAAKEMRANDEIKMGEKDEKMSIRNDIIGHMDAPFNLAVGIKKPFGPGSLRFLLTLAHKNRAAVEKLMGFAPPSMFVKRDLMGQQVYDIGQPVPVEGISLAVTDKVIAIGGERSIEATVRSGAGKAEPLMDSPAFKSIAQYVPKECWFMTYVDGTRINRFLIAIQKADEKTEGEDKKSDDDEPLSNMISAMIPMMLAGAGPGMTPDSLEAQTKYEGRTLFTIGTKGDSIDLNVVSVAGEGDK